MTTRPSNVTWPSGLYRRRLGNLRQHKHWIFYTAIIKLLWPLLYGTYIFIRKIQVFRLILLSNVLAKVASDFGQQCYAFELCHINKIYFEDSRTLKKKILLLSSSIERHWNHIENWPSDSTDLTLKGHVRHWMQQFYKGKCELRVTNSLLKIWKFLQNLLRWAELRQITTTRKFLRRLW